MCNTLTCCVSICLKLIFRKDIFSTFVLGEQGAVMKIFENVSSAQKTKLRSFRGSITSREKSYRKWGKWLFSHHSRFSKSPSEIYKSYRGNSFLSSNIFLTLFQRNQSIRTATKELKSKLKKLFENEAGSQEVFHFFLCFSNGFFLLCLFNQFDYASFNNVRFLHVV